MFNFTEAGQRLLEAGAAQTIANAEQLATAVDQWLADPALGRKVGQCGHAVVERHRGALATLMGHIAGLLDSPGP